MLRQDPDGGKHYATLSAGDVNVGTFVGTIDKPTQYSSSVYLGEWGMRDGTAYDGTVTLDGRKLVISGGIIRSIS